MAKHQITGREGERLAQAYFDNKGYEILQTNWRYGHLEVDIIALKNGMLHFIEVKTLTEGTAGLPEERVDKKKMINLLNAAELFMNIKHFTGPIQFDVLAIVLKKNENDFFLLEDVYI